MTLLDLIREEAGPRSREVILAASLAGVANTLILSFVNDAAHANGARPLQFAGIVLALVLYVVCARRTYRVIHTVIESALYKIKARIVAKINRAELRRLEDMGISEIYDRMSENVAVVSESAGFIANLLQSFCIVLFAALYLASLSSAAVALLLVINVIGLGLFASNNIVIMAALDRIAATRIEFLDRLTDLLRGMKEIRFSRRREADIEGDLLASADRLRLASIDADVRFADNWILAESFQFLSLLAIVSVLPMYADVSGDALTALVAGFLFLWGPLGGSVSDVPALMRANNALANIEALEHKLAGPDADVAPLAVGPFASLEARDLCFEYVGADDGEQFRIGPINLEIRAGEVVFIVGGNGSGKSTFLKVLTGLYPASTGRLLLNGAAVHPSQRADYRALFSTIFTDFHLFGRLYGLLDVSEADVHPLLRRMRIDDKTSYAPGQFTRRDLSTGQRKRLAMVVTLLEDRPICVLDEWAADQDPQFRKYFYEELVPSFKQRGVTVIAVTHDDRYFHCADRVVTMEYGQVRSVEDMRRPPSP